MVAVVSAALGKDPIQILELQVTIDKQTNHETISHSHGSGFGGGEDTAIDAAQDDDGDQQGPNAILQSIADVAPGEGSGVLIDVAVLLAVEAAVQAQGDTDQDAGQEARP